MKNLTFLSNFWRKVSAKIHGQDIGLGLRSQCSDVSLDRRLTVDSPSVHSANGVGSLMVRINPRITSLRFASALLLFLTLGIGNAWGVEVKDTIALVKFAGETGSSYVTSAKTGSTNKGVSAIMNQWNPSSGQIKVNQGNTTSLSASNFSVYNSAAMPGAITKVEIVFTAGTVTNNYCQVTAGTSVCSSNPTYNTSNAVSGTLSSGKGTLSKTFTESAGNKYFRVSWAKNGGTVKASYIIITYVYHTVTYNGNGNTSGSVPTDATKYLYNANVTVKGNTGSLAKTGYTFSGWNTNSTGTGTNYAAGSGTFKITSDVTLYAKWVSACGAPTAPTKGSVSLSSQTVSWTAPASAPSGGYLVAYSTATSTMPGEGVTSTSGNYTVLAIAAGTTTANIPCSTAGTYNWWVRSKCGASEYSGWVAGTAFTMNTIYLKTNANWRQADAKFAAYYWDATTNGWTSFMTTQTDCETGIYKAVYPSTYTNIKFVRCNPADGTPQFGDGHAWNETGNLTIPSGKDCFTIPAGDWSSTGNGTSNANWSTYAQKVTVSFDKNTSANGVTDPADQCVVKSTGKATEPTISNMSYGVLGKELDGWYTAASGGSKITFSSQTYTADTELHAHWKDGATTTIALDPTWSTYDWRADNCVIFAHFYIDGTTQAQDVQMIGNSCDDILIAYAPYGATHVAFARCKSGTSSLGANWDTDANIYNYVNGLAIAANYQYSITGWGSGKVGTAQKEISAYTPTTYTISYNAGTTAYTSGNAISGSKANQSKSCDIDFTLPSSVVFTTTGYTQDGWATSNGGAKAYNLGGTYTTNSAQTFYPHWAAKTMTVTLDNQGATTAGAASVTGTYGSGLPSIAANKPAKTGYNFQGYFASTGGSGTRYIKPDGTADSNWDKEVATTIYAYWTAKTTTVSFNQNSGTGGQSSALTATYGSAMPAISGKPERSGYVFGGYYDGTGGTGTQYYTAAGTSARNWDKESATATLYARWYGDPIAWCDPDITIEGDIHLTSYKDIYVQSTSGAGNLIEISSSDFGSATHVEVAYLDADNSDAEVDKEQSVFRLCNDGSVNYNTIDGFDPDYAWGTTHSIKYTPNAYNKYDNYKLQLKIFNGDSIIKTVTHNLYGRSLPQEFVIASKHNGEWFALPNTMGTSLETVTPIKITVDNTTTPTAAAYAPTTTVYKGAARYRQTSNVNSIRLTSTGSNWLETGSTAQLSLSTTASPAESVENKQVWYLKSSDFGAYTLKMDPAQSPAKQLGMSGSYMGMYATPTAPSGDIYLLPITNKYTEIPATVTEWGQNSVIVAANPGATATKAKAHVEAGTPTADQTITAINAAMGTAKNIKVPVGSINLADLTNNEGKLLYIEWYNSSSVLLGISRLTIPRIIAASRNMYKTGETTKGPWATEVHVLPGVTLTANTASYSPSGATINELHVYPGATLDVTTGTLTTTTLRLHNGWTRAGEKQYNVARVHIASTAALAKTTGSIDYDIYESSEGNHYYPFAVPFTTALSAIDYADASLATASTYGTHYGIDKYNGATRAENGNSSDNWERVTEGNIEAGRGYTIVALPVKGEAIIRVPLTFDNNWTNAGEKASYGGTTKNVVSVAKHAGTAASSSQRHAGWNMVGVPFMSNYTGSDGMYSSGTLIDGQIVVNPSNPDPYSYSGSIPYVSVPSHDFAEYVQTAISDIKLLPGWSFFIQVASSGNLTFLTASQTNDGSTPIYAPQRTQEEQPVVRTGIVLSGAEASDKTTFLISDQFSAAEYEIGADLEKMFGSGYTLAVYSLSDEKDILYAYNAMSTTDINQVIPIGFRAPEDGEYTFSFNEQYAGQPIERLDLIDNLTGTLTDLLMEDYTFTTERTQDNDRFTLNVVQAPKLPTSVENTEAGKAAQKTEKVLINGTMYIIRDKKMYDVTGKRVYNINK